MTRRRTTGPGDEPAGGTRPRTDRAGLGPLRGPAFWASAAGAAAILALGCLLYAASEPAATDARSIVGVRVSSPQTPEAGGPDVRDEDRMDEAAYVVEVGAIQAAAVEVLGDSNDKLLRYDTLSAADVAVMRKDLAELGRLERRAEDLVPPGDRAGHHGLFLSAVGIMRSAAATAHGLASDPVEATWPRFREHGMLVEEADALLRRSNEMLNRDHETVEGARRDDQRRDGE